MGFFCLFYKDPLGKKQNKTVFDWELIYSTKIEVPWGQGLSLSYHHWKAVNMTYFKPRMEEVPDKY